MQKSIKPLFLFFMIVAGFLIMPSYLVQADAIKTDLITSIAAVEAAVNAENSYTPSSFALFVDAIDNLGGQSAIQTMIDDPLAEQAAVDNLILMVNNALSLLVLRADTSLLNTANNAAIAAYYGDRNLYTSSSYSQFVVAVVAYGNYQATDDLLDDLNVTQAAVDTFVLLINNALSLLELKADTTLLEDAYDTAISFDLTGNTPASIEMFTTELERIRLIMIGDDTNQTLCAQTISDLIASYDLLVPLANKTQLQSAINSGDNIKEEKYTVSSFYILDILLVTAKAANENDNALQNDVDQLALDIASAIEGLVYIPTGIELTVDSETINVGTYVTPGESNIVGYLSSNPAVATVDISGNVSGVSFGNAEIIITLANGVVETIPIFVKEKITTTTLIIISSIPVVAIGLGIAMIYVKIRPVEIVQRVKKRNKKIKNEKQDDVLVDSEV